MSAISRIKMRGVRAAIAANGGIEGAALSVDRSSSQVGRWNSRNDADLPVLDAAFHLDEVAMAATGRAPILSALAAELNHVCIRLPDCAGGSDAVVMSLAEATREFGDVAGAVTDALADGKRDAGEDAEIIEQIDEAMAALARMRALVAGPVPVGVASGAGRKVN